MYLTFFPEAPVWAFGSPPASGHMVIDWSTHNLWQPLEKGLSESDIPDTDPLAPFVVIFTSGSSGMPKAVVHSMQSLCEGARCSNDFFDANASDQSALSLSLAHIGGLMVVIRAMMVGSSVYLSETPRPQKASFCSLVPTQLYRLLRDPISVSVLRLYRAVLIGGAFCPRNLVEKALEAGIPISLSYGLTEASGHVAACLPGHRDNLSAVATIANGREVSVSSGGDILLRGKGLALGYWRNGHLCKLPRDDFGWFETKDLGSIDAEGKLRLSGRSDEVIIIGGENIDPIQLAQELAPYCSMWFYNIIGQPDEEWGERVALVFWATEPPDLKGQDTQIFQKLTGLARVHAIYCIKVDELPAKITAKLSRQAVSGQCPGASPKLWCSNKKIWKELC